MADADTGLIVAHEYANRRYDAFVSALGIDLKGNPCVPEAPGVRAPSARGDAARQ